MSSHPIERSGQQLDLRQERGPLVIGLAVTALHLLTAPSGLFWMDSGDFVTASWELGVPHPTGFPLYVLLGKFFTLLPFGSVAFRLNLMSAAFSGVASWLVALTVTSSFPNNEDSVARGRVANCSAIVAVCTLWAASMTGWLGRCPDVYSLHLALVAAGLLLCVRARDHRHFVLLCLVTGLGLANHAEFRLIAPVLICLGGLRLVRVTRRRWLFVATAAAALVWPLICYLYLPLASARGPYHTWGQPDSWPRFIDHVTGARIQAAFGVEFLSTDPARLAEAGRVWLNQFGGGYGWLLALGAFGLAAYGRRFCVAASAVLTIDVIYSLWINPMGLRDHQNGAITALIIGLGVGGALVWTGSVTRLLSPTRRVFLSGAVGIVALFTLGHGIEPARHQLAASWGLEDLSFLALQMPSEGAVVLSASDNLAAGRLYWRVVGGLRADTQALDRSELSDGPLLARRSREGPFALAGDETVESWASSGVGAGLQTGRDRLGGLISAALESGRMVTWEGADPGDSAGLWGRLVPGFPLHQITFQTVAQATPAEIGALVDRASGVTDWQDPWFRRWQASYFNWLGSWLYQHERFREAGAGFQMAAQADPNSSAAQVNLGVLAARSLNWAQARSHALRAIELDPLNSSAWGNLARYECVLGDASAALGAFTAVERLTGRPHPGLLQFFAEACPTTPL